MLLNMVNIETGLRGFVAGGDEKFLEPFKAGLKDFGDAFEKAKALTSDNAAQQARLERLMAHHRQFMEVANGLATQRREVTAGKTPLENLLRDFSAGKDKAAMDSFRAGVAEFAKEESNLLAARSAAMDSTMSATTYTLIFGGLALFALTALAGLALTRSVFRQLGAEPSVAADAVNAVAAGDLTAEVPLRPWPACATAWSRS
jgi:methyl-accepting chemotaxis protein